jgi:hypothetical protein
MGNQVLEIESDSLEAARKEAKAKIPEGLHLLSEKILSDGKPKNVKGVAETIKAAFEEARSKLPAGAKVIKEEKLFSPSQNILEVQAFDQETATALVQREINQTQRIEEIRLKAPGKKGLLGIGKRPNIYEAKVLQPAVVKLIIKRRAKIQVEIGERRLKEPDYVVGRHLAKQGIYREQIGREVIGYFDPLKVIFQLFDKKGRRLKSAGSEATALVWPPDCNSQEEQSSFIVEGSTVAQALEAFPETMSVLDLMSQPLGNMEILIMGLLQVGTGEVGKFIFESTVLPFFQRYSVGEKVVIVEEIEKEVVLNALLNFLCSEVVRPPGVEDIGVNKLKVRAANRVKQIRSGGK